MASMREILRAWREAGAYVYTKDGRKIPLKQLWEEIYEEHKTDWEKVFNESPT